MKEEEIVVTKDNAEIGMMVKRNPKYWSWNNQDCDKGHNPTVGEIIGKPFNHNNDYWVAVKWNGDESTSYNYRVGYNHFDLFTAYDEKRIQDI
jgi:hypothetical protein